MIIQINLQAETRLDVDAVICLVDVFMMKASTLIDPAVL